MRHGYAWRRLGRDSAHRRALMRNMVTSLIEHERITTTMGKAKEVRRFADHMITLAKRGDNHAKVQALGFIQKKELLPKLFGELAQRFATRPGGYTRVLRLNDRKSDSAPMALVEYMDNRFPPIKSPRQARRDAQAEKAAKAAVTAQQAREDLPLD